MRERLRTAALLAACLPLAACGIQETDVIAAGGAATIDVLPARQVRMLLFFSHDSVLIPVPRTVGESDFTGDESGQDSNGEDARPPTEKTIAALLVGPNEAEKRAGMVNEASLPAPGTPARPKVIEDGVDVTIEAPLDGLTPPAERQLVCTVAFAESTDGTVIVTLRGTDGARTPARCDPRSALVPTASVKAPR
ncbi:hypothetical protein ABZS61_08865 [Streptomyces sp. NPDC005566]|uniref:hypothetical protein n=1 Tax=Streptomyces sp. NPDC005566 TaxID=3156886 RepID=UPI0033A76C66